MKSNSHSANEVKQQVPLTRPMHCNEVKRQSNFTRGKKCPSHSANEGKRQRQEAKNVRLWPNKNNASNKISLYFNTVDMFPSMFTCPQCGHQDHFWQSKPGGFEIFRQRQNILEDVSASVNDRWPGNQYSRAKNPDWFPRRDWKGQKQWINTLLHPRVVHKSYPAVIEEIIFSTWTPVNWRGSGAII